MRRISLLALIATLAAACTIGTTTAAPATTTSAGGAATVAATPAAVQLQVQNASSQEICYLYISPVSDPNWGPDQLGSRTLSPGETDTYSMPPGQWDIKAEDCSHNQLFVMRNATIAADSALVLHD
jgi:hypothetical protein